MSEFTDKLRGKLIKRTHYVAYTDTTETYYTCALCLGIVPDDYEVCSYCTGKQEKKVASIEAIKTKREEERKVLGIPKRGRGRPKGSKNKPKRRNAA